MAFKTLNRIPDFEIYYEDTGEKIIEFFDTAGDKVNFTGKDVEIAVSSSANPLIAASPLFTVVGSIIGDAADGKVGFSVTTANWSNLDDDDFETNGRANLFYDIQEKDAGLETNKLTLGKGKYIVEKDIGE